MGNESTHSNPYGEGDDSINTPHGLESITEDEVEDVDDHGDDEDEEPEHDAHS